MRKSMLQGSVLLWIALLFSAALAMAQNEQFVPVLSYRTGPYAVNGAPFADGFISYLAMLNERDGGINGVKLAWEECETVYKNDRGVECYERLKSKGPAGASAFNPLSTGITYALIERATTDKIPIVSLGYGRTDASDGRIFPYIFPAVTNYWSQNTAKIKFIGMKEGGMDKLKGKKIANVHHDSAYGKETIPVLEEQARRYGFALQNFAVAHPGLDQKAIWLQVRQYNPDWVILRGWGVMNQTALKEAARVGFPRNKMVGVWWSCSEQDTVPADEAAKDYICANFHGVGKEFPVVQDIIKLIYDQGKNPGPADAVGTVMWNRGVVTAFITTEGIRNAMGKFGNKPVNGEQIQWGLEQLNITPQRIKEVGGEGLLSPIKLSCKDHEGGGAVIFQQWDGSKWVSASDWIATDQELVRPMIEASAAQYAQEKSITPRQCE